MSKKQRRKYVRDHKPGELPCRFTVFFDGCCEPINPGGTAGYGAVIYDRQGTVFTDPPQDKFGPQFGRVPILVVGVGALAHLISGMIEAAPTTSNNVAEYLAINSVMDWLIANGHQNETTFAWGDSRLVICQLWGWPVIGQGKWKIHGVDCVGARCKQCHGKRGHYADMAVAAREKLKQLPRMSGFWFPRDQNSIADELSKAHLKAAGIEFRIQPEDDEPKVSDAIHEQLQPRA